MIDDERVLAIRKRQEITNSPSYRVDVRFLLDRLVEAERYRRGMENHLCPADIGDWVACAGGHNPHKCDACDNSPVHLHMINRLEGEAERLGMERAAKIVQVLYKKAHVDPTSLLHEGKRNGLSEAEAAIRAEAAKLGKKEEL